MENLKTQETELSTKELLLKLFSLGRYLYTNWRVWLAAFLFGACLTLFKDIFAKEEKLYRAVINFNLELGGNSSASQLGGLAGSLGLFDQGGASSGELFTSQNFPNIVRSRAVFERALMKKVEVDGDSLLMINYVADSSDMAENEWAGDLFHRPFQTAIDYVFEQKDPKDFTPLENMIVRSIYEKLHDATFIGTQKGSASIMNMQALLTNEKLAKAWAETVLETTEEFYVEMKTKKTRRMLKIQEERLGKIQLQLYATDSKAARLALENPNVVDPRGRQKESQVMRNSTFLSNQYVQQLATIEALNRTILEQTPIFTVLEYSRLPLETEYPKGNWDVKLGSLAALALCLFILIIIDAYRKVVLV
ncbi:hypothetical protein LAG90_01375 [Marinilongibacter aquaticus]|uniref:hypothetical protein n=1 Tax=Marinilongibacter aquaticus TaxID=2975157 RepID=UPI0021BD896B|nr:hypothetical protein [Marinilongibacter aquaticus]UBM59307.1 hypothetical protein LAG90_01375 [Marinilongibacter aquaticus]